MFEVSVTGRFVARHQLPEPAGSLEPSHEHVWRVTLTYAGPMLDRNGLLIDFGLVKARLGKLTSTFDETDLNHVPQFADRCPSAENVALYLAEQLRSDLAGDARLKCVEVEEEPGCVARYFPPGPC